MTDCHRRQVSAVELVKSRVNQPAAAFLSPSRVMAETLHGENGLIDCGFGRLFPCSLADCC